MVTSTVAGLGPPLFTAVPGSGLNESARSADLFMGKLARNIPARYA